MNLSLKFGDGIIIGLMFIVAFIISYVAIPIIIRAAKRRDLFDQPDEDRKLHYEAIPTLGGIAIFLAFLLSYSVSPLAGDFAGFSYLVGALLILFFTGLKDDLVVLSAKKKLVAQLTAAALVIFGGGVVINDFHGVLGLAEIPYWVAVPITFFTVIVVINAVNLIDGIDGLAGGIAAIASVVFGAGFWFAGQLPMAMFSFCLAGALLGFLFYNFSPASIFMGDTGSMLLGFLLSIQAIEFIGLSSLPAFAKVFGHASVILPIAILGFPLFDTLRVVFKRLRRDKSIFDPGQDHVHHELLRMGFSHKNAALLLYAKSTALIAIVATLAVFQINVNILLVALLASCLLVFPTNGSKREMLSNFFGFDWLAYRSRKWGIEFDRDKVVELNAHQQNGDEYDEEVLEEREEEVDSIAV